MDLIYKKLDYSDWPWVNSVFLNDEELAIHVGCNILLDAFKTKEELAVAWWVMEEIKAMEKDDRMVFVIFKDYKEVGCYMIMPDGQMAIWISKEHRNNGIATQAFIDIYKEYNDIYFLIDKNNLPSIRSVVKAGAVWKGEEMDGRRLYRFS